MSEEPPACGHAAILGVVLAFACTAISILGGEPVLRSGESFPCFACAGFSSLPSCVWTFVCPGWALLWHTELHKMGALKDVLGALMGRNKCVLASLLIQLVLRTLKEPSIYELHACRADKGVEKKKQADLMIQRMKVNLTGV